jgi:hypothetical protein
VIWLAWPIRLRRRLAGWLPLCVLQRRPRYSNVQTARTVALELAEKRGHCTVAVAESFVLNLPSRQDAVTRFTILPQEPLIVPPVFAGLPPGRCRSALQGRTWDCSQASTSSTANRNEFRPKRIALSLPCLTLRSIVALSNEDSFATSRVRSKRTE